jgi:hypothetical protein
MYAGAEFDRVRRLLGRVVSEDSAAGILSDLLLIVSHRWFDAEPAVLADLNDSESRLARMIDAVRQNQWTIASRVAEEIAGVFGAVLCCGLCASVALRTREVAVPVAPTGAEPRRALRAVS